jgi:hypothetical protein
MSKFRALAGVLATLIGASTMGCASRNVNAQSGQAPPYSAPAERSRPGMSTRNKVLLVAGAAALYYLYQKHKNSPGQGPQGRYFRSRNGRVYYRDLKTGAYQWVDPPSQPIQVPADEYQRYFGSEPADQNGVIRQAPPQWNNPAYR